MELLHKPDFEETRKRWRAFWAGEIIDRPCVNVLAPKDGMVVPPHPRGLQKPGDDYRNLAEQYDRWAAAMHFGGEAIPNLRPNFGPDVFAAFFGAKLEYSQESGETSWAVPCIEDWSFTDTCFDEPRGKWWRGVLDSLRAISEFGEGRFMVSVPDLHSNMDCLSAMRGPQRLCEDLFDFPEAVDRAMLNVRGVYPQVYEAIYEAGRMQTVGTISWLQCYCEGRFTATQCDFIYMIGPEHFRRWVLPALEEEAAYLDHTVYHLDGPAALVHLDDILAIEGLDVIQWVPGAGQLAQIGWLDLLHRIQDAGKGLYLYGSPDEIKVFHKELRPERVIYDTWAGSPAEADALLKWLTVNT